MNGPSATRRLARLGIVFVLPIAAAPLSVANAQPAASEKPGSLHAVDFNFVGQGNFGAPFLAPPSKHGECPPAG